jgi:hypothetical protein
VQPFVILGKSGNAERTLAALHDAVAAAQAGDIIEIRGEGRALLPATAFRLAKDSPGKGAGPGGRDLGADVDLVGPGAAYEAWRQTPEYQEWRKKIAAVMAEACGE